MRTKWLYLPLSLLVITSSQAGIRTADGQLISTGHSVAKLIQYLGKPISKSSRHGCINRRCSKKGRIEAWVYHHEKRIWTIHIADGVIIDTEWTRSARGR